MFNFNIMNGKFQKIFRLFSASFLMLFSFTVYAEQHTVKVNVCDTPREPIIGVDNLIKGISHGIMTDVKRVFQLTAKPSQELEYILFGYKTKTI